MSEEHPVGQTLTFPRSVPTIPPVLDQPEYPATDIQTLQTFDYQAYKNQFGVAPPWDSSRPVQEWFDTDASTVIGDIYEYQAILSGPSGPSIGPRVIPAQWARTPNIPPPGINGSGGVLTAPVRGLLMDEVLRIIADVPIPGTLTVMVIRPSLQGATPAVFMHKDQDAIAEILAYVRSHA